MITQTNVEIKCTALDRCTQTRQSQSLSVLAEILRNLMKQFLHGMRLQASRGLTLAKNPEIVTEQFNLFSELCGNRCKSLEKVCT
jgi:hypothetical protein